MLKAARLAGGYGTQQALSDALNAAAGELGLRGVSVGPRQVRRWESASPPWPHAHHQRFLSHVLSLSVEELGFVPPWHEKDDTTGIGPGGPGAMAAPMHQRLGGTARRGGSRAAHPPSVAADFAVISTCHRRMYWTVDPLHLHPAVVEHIRLGAVLLPETIGPAHVAIARAVAESSLLAGRIEFFDLRQPADAAASFVHALQFAGEADDSLLGSAVLAHAAFVPGFAGDRDGVADRLAAARAHARRGRAGPLMQAWIDAVDAECATRSGDTATALALINRAEVRLRNDDGPSPPEWMDWFTPVRLSAFKGNTQLRAGQIRRARETLTAVLDELPVIDSKQRAVILADLAAVEIADENVTQACRRIDQALDQLTMTWYSTAMERIREARRLLRPRQDESCVRELDDRLYGWDTTLSVVRR